MRCNSYFSCYAKSITSQVTHGVGVSGFCSVKRIRVFDFPGRDTNPSQVSSQQTLVLIYLPPKDGKLSYLRQKRGCTNIQILAEPGIYFKVTKMANEATLVEGFTP